MEQPDELTFIRNTAAKTRTSAVTGPAAVLIHGIKPLDRVEVVDLVLPGQVNPSMRHLWPKNSRFRSGYLPSEHIRTKEGVRVVSLIRALFDTHRYYGEIAGATAIDAARKKWPSLTTPELHQRAESIARCKGIKKFRQAIDASRDDMDSALDTRARLTLEAADLPEVKSLEFQANITFEDPQGRLSNYRVDALINGFLICEFDGLVKYQEKFGETVQDVLAKERMREHHLLTAGFPIVRAHWAELDPENPDASSFVNRLRQALERYPVPHQPPARHIKVGT
ncbi:hypothetical protein [Corynebacterium lubricantis]|uniref:hypothetical protein n=1 Tax=Corynebacterium lubricantis TaxID=541095 RepID=UPI00039A10D2|nr:hypothetical protein [Corynebacterium lubricantis]